MLTTKQSEWAYTLQWLKGRMKEAVASHKAARSILTEKGDSVWGDERLSYPNTLKWMLDCQRDIEALGRVIAMVEFEQKQAESMAPGSTRVDPAVSVP